MWAICKLKIIHNCLYFVLILIGNEIQENKIDWFVSFYIKTVNKMRNVDIYFYKTSKHKVAIY